MEEILHGEQLQEIAPISLETELAVLTKAGQISEALKSPYEKTVALIGPCAMTQHPVELVLEGQKIAALQDENLITVQRMPVWKPRTNPDKDWKGLETSLVKIHADGKGYALPGTEVEGLATAYSILVEAAAQHGGAAIEVANTQHIDRYEPLLSFAWSGSRSIGNREQILALATRDPKVPLGIKNGMSGDISEALAVVEAVERERAPAIEEEKPAPAVLIFRGGEDLDIPEKWENAYKEALNRTGGKLIVDVAHGSEMAHDPNGNFKKSVEGQIRAMEAVIRLASEGYVSAGIMIEASDLESPTDPVMPLQTALDGVKRLHKIKLAQLAKAKV